MLIMAEDDVSLQQIELRPNAFDDLTRLFVEDLGEADLTAQKQQTEIELRNLRLGLGIRPVAYDLKQLHKMGHARAPESSLYDGYDVWLIVHKVGVLDGGGLLKAKAVQYEVEFPEREVYCLNLFPKTELETRAAAKIDYGVTLSASGAAEASTSVLGGAPWLPLAGGVRFSAATSAEVTGRLAWSLDTPIVQAVGEGSSKATWRFSRYQQHMLGDQTMLQTVLLPRKERDRLEFRIRGRLEVTSKIFPWGDARVTDWIAVTCPLLGVSGESHV